MTTPAHMVLPYALAILGSLCFLVGSVLSLRILMSTDTTARPPASRGRLALPFLVYMLGSLCLMASSVLSLLAVFRPLP